MNIPNYVTLLRIIIIPFFPLIYLKYSFFKIDLLWMPYILLFILAFCELTDLVDGFLARKRNQVTDLGKVMDPMADSITNISVFLTFTQSWIDIPILLVFVFLYREFFINTLRTICALKGVALAARKSGKIKTLLQAIVSITIVLLLIPFTLGYLSLEKLRWISLGLVSIAAIYSVISAVDYIYANRKYMKKFLAE
ncbi:MAG: CDP-diacylglycerol--glycerol-3-phosphate 3-phosphatidyltransferase [Candidatus Anoxychlamydiales bacterium]|nr:CDP-diacylglycerol--glycerol-3-phosphate 3-phosphatidyltransferase [Candidatus Anoxychlamydiales bacterium]NGX49710.1 CDP-diacylglycerol--glycerol-3-phosphate 3-phosphatidyltransferase [Candidatus Anoxychlamydiales bacterium]